MTAAADDPLPPQAGRALAHWPALAGQAGLSGPVEGLRVLIHRDQPGTRRAVLSFAAAGQGVILKAAAEPWQPAHFDACLDAMEEARRAMGGGAPRLLARLAGQQVALIERVEGTSLEAGMEAAPDPQAMRRLFRRGAEWLGRFQRATAGPPVAFDPSGMIARHARLRDDIAAGRSDILEGRRFAAISERFATAAARAAGLSAARAAAHGDLHPGNLILGPEGRVSAIDFNPMRLVWTGQDIADYAIEFATRYVAPNRQPEGGWLPDGERRAFARGHGAPASAGADPFADPVTEALMLAALLRRWQRIGAREGSRAERLEALMRVAARACPGSW